MSENNFKVGDVVKHVHPGFSSFNLYIVKDLGNGSFKCRFSKGDSFGSDEFEANELKHLEPSKKSNLKTLTAAH